MSTVSCSSLAHVNACLETQIKSKSKNKQKSFARNEESAIWKKEMKIYSNHVQGEI
jgi:hypothetical protein